MESVLLIDGENFKKKIKDVFGSYGQAKPIWNKYDFNSLFEKALGDTKVDRKIFYFARIKENPNTLKKSRELIEEQRLLKTHLENTGFSVVLVGEVRMHLEDITILGKRINILRGIPIFREKGVDVKIAVDMVTWSCDKKIETVILASSDSDLQPAINETKKRGVNCIYLGFEAAPNKGIVANTHKTILLRDSEVCAYANVE